MTGEQFRALFAANFDDVWRFARRRVNGAAEADDLAAEVFAVAWRRRTEIPADAVRLWLFGVARRLRRELDRRDPGWSGHVLTESPGERSRRYGPA